MHTTHTQAGLDETNEPEPYASNGFLRSEGAIAAWRPLRDSTGHPVLSEKTLPPFERPSKHHACITPPSGSLQARRSIHSASRKVLLQTSCCHIRVTLLPLLCLFLLMAAAQAATNVPTLIIYRFAGGPARTGEISFPVITALWSDGQIVWSESRIKGGPPYRQGRFAPEKLESLLATLEGKGVFKDAARFRGNFGPDAGYTIIAIDDGRRRLRIESWHELVEEQNTNLVATAAGISTLGGAKREDVVRKQPEAYRRLRDTWSEIRRAVGALTPKTGEPYAGEIPIPGK
jgi:hypothetical protein